MSAATPVVDLAPLPEPDFQDYGRWFDADDMHAYATAHGERVMAAQAADRAITGEQFYMALHGHEGAVWAANEHQQVWRDAANRLNATCAALTRAASEQSAWISVDDRLPLPDEVVLVSRFAGPVATPTHPGYPGKSWVVISHLVPRCTTFLCDLIDTGNVTHWMPLPAAPGTTAQVVSAESTK
jgi:hypothetical protein